VEELTDESLMLLMFDPGCHQMKKFKTSTDIGLLMGLLRRDVASLTARQYQILSIHGLISDEQDYNVSVNSPLLTNFLYLLLALTSPRLYVFIFFNAAATSLNHKNEIF